MIDILCQFLEMSIVLSKRKILAELDYTISEIQEKFNLKKGEKEVKLSYHCDKENKNNLLYDNNHILLGIDKTTFIEQLDFIYEFRNHENMGIMEATYKTLESKNNGIFDNEIVFRL